MVLVTYKGKTRNIPDRYLEGLEGKDREAQIESIFEGITRPKTAFISKKSNWTETFNSIYGKEIEQMKGGRNLKNIAKVSNMPVKALEEVLKRVWRLIIMVVLDRIKHQNRGHMPECIAILWVGIHERLMRGITKKYNVEFIHFIKPTKTVKKDKTLKKSKIPKKKSVTKRKKEALYIV